MRKLEPIADAAQEDYRAIREGAAFVRETDAGFLKLEGKDRLDLLNRLSTNDLNKMRPEEVRSTLLLTEKGRILDLATLIPSGKGHLLEVARGNEEKVLAWIEKFIMMEDVRITRTSTIPVKNLLVGPRVKFMLKKWGVDTSAKSRLQEVGRPGSGVWAVQDALYTEDAWNLYRDESAEGAAELIDSLTSEAREVGREALEAFRLEQGVPRAGRELSEKVNPLEAGLERFVSFTKGCYLGQEVVARLDTYSKLHHRLTGFVVGCDESALEDGDAIVRSGENVGWISSHAYSPLAGACIALGYLRTAAGTGKLEVAGRRGCRLTPVGLPLGSSRESEESEGDA